MRSVCAPFSTSLALLRAIQIWILRKRTQRSRAAPAYLAQHNRGRSESFERQTRMNDPKLLSESGNDLSSIGKERNSIADSLQYCASSVRPNSWFSASVRAETITSTPSRRAVAMSSGSQSQPLGLGKIARRQEPASIQ